MENRIVAAMAALGGKKEKAFITYLTAGLPDLEGMKELILEQEAAGVTVLELGIPFSDPAADGPVIQAASYQSIKQGTNVRSVFQAVKELRKEGLGLPILFMLYYNTVYHYGLSDFVTSCIDCGVDGLIIPDLPKEEQGELSAYLERADAPVLIQLVSPVSKERIPLIVEGAKGFIYCVSAMGVTGQGGSFHKELREYLSAVGSHTNLPVMMGFGIRTAKDVLPVADLIDGAIVGSHFVNLLMESGYDRKVAGEYCREFKRELHAVV
ncbi:tryptophan synthase alpha chain [Clostridia bacterium]|nr:tryptophan synthase alpha chain [Clostridia bacterium]